MHPLAWSVLCAQMSTQSSDTVELPVVAPESGPAGRSDPAGGPESPRGSDGAGHGGLEARRPADRRAVRNARRRARRLRRLYALSGLAVLAAFLAATVVVLDMIR